MNERMISLPLADFRRFLTAAEEFLEQPAKVNRQTMLRLQLQTMKDWLPEAIDRFQEG